MSLNINTYNDKWERTGNWLIYGNNNLLHYKATYKNGVLDGWFEYYGFTTQVQYKVFYVNGKEKYKEQHTNGKVFSKRYTII